MSKLTLHCLGDIYASRRSSDLLRSDLSSLDAAADLLCRADLRFANLEAPLLAEGRPLFSTGVRLKSPPEAAGILRRLGLDLVSLANNHMMDFGPQGLAATLHELNRQRLPAVGVGPTLAAARSPVILTARGQRVGFLAACDNEGGGASHGGPGVSLIAPRALAAAVRRLRAQADYVVVAVHTGIEFCGCPEPFFVKLARRLVDAGATVVAGHHPHVPQGLECRGNGLIVYSLGDFLFDLPRDPADMTPHQRRFRGAHPVLEVELEDGRVTAHRMHWLTRDADGRYAFPAPDRLDELEREYERLCAVLADPPALRQQMGGIYRHLLRGMLYYAPMNFSREFAHGGSRHLRAFLWWLATLRRGPKRRWLREGFSSLLGWGVARLKGEQVALCP
jgi:poly-gamma-glutamate synthesis protein (capsule biosynthesis protein)